MDQRQIGAWLVFDRLGVPLKVDDFGCRLILQKSMYLAQASGVDLGYHYQWYLRGPYSPGLTRDAFAIAAEPAEEIEEATRGWSLDDTSRTRLEAVAELMPTGPEESQAQTLELLASVHFLVDRGQVSRADPVKIKATLDRYDKNFTQPEIEEALKNLQVYGLLRKKPPQDRC